MAAASQTGRRITTHEATVKTAAVEIKTLSVSGKQVTLALFRQLPEKDLIDGTTLQLRGIPWGRVNYCPSKECSGTHLGTHHHVVWQEGNELRRATCYEHGYRTTGAGRRCETQIFGWGRIAAVDAVMDGSLPLDGDRLHCGHNGMLFFERPYSWGTMDSAELGMLYYDRPGRAEKVLVKEELLLRVRHYRREPHLDFTREQLEAARNTACEDTLGHVPSSKEVREFLTEHLSRRAWIVAEWGTRYDELLALDQLFIAV